MDKREKVIRSGSAEAKELRLRSNHGEFLLHWKEFWCVRCQRHYTIKEVKQHENIPV